MMLSSLVALAGQEPLDHYVSEIARRLAMLEQTNPEARLRVIENRLDTIEKFVFAILIAVLVNLTVSGVKLRQETRK